MAEKNAIWLKPKPSHIDENFEDFLSYLRNCPDKASDLYQESLRLLDQRIDILIGQRRDLPVYRHLTDIKTRQFNVRLCSAWLLAAQSPTPGARKLVLLTLINNLIQICLLSPKTFAKQQTLPFKSINPLLDMAFSLVFCKAPDTLKLSWSDIIQPTDNRYNLLGKKEPEQQTWSVDQFLNSFLDNKFTEYESSLFEDRGALIVQDGKMTIVPVSKDHFVNTALKNSLAESTFIPRWGVSIYSDKKSQIKASKQGDVTAIAECIDSIIADQLKCKIPKKMHKTYSNGDLVPVEVIDIDNKSIAVRTIDPDYAPIEAKLVFDNSLHLFKKNYPFDLWAKELPIGAKINAKYNELSKTFSLTEQFIEFMHEVVLPGDVLTCKFYREVQLDEGLYEFISDDGCIICVSLTEEEDCSLDEQANASIKVLCFDEKKFRGCIRGCLDSPIDNPEDFDAEEARQSVVSDFVSEISEISISTTDDAYIKIDSNFLKEICYTLNVLQSRESNPLMRYKYLALSRLISVMARFDPETEYGDYLSRYIKTLILFAQADKDENKCISALTIPAGLMDDEIIASGTEILRILSQFSLDYSSEVNQMLSEFVDSDNQLISRTASLVQAYNRLKSLLDDKILKGIKRQMLEGLSVIFDGDSNLDLSNRDEVSFGYEDDTKEFKYSFFTAPNNAKEKRQEYTICKAICGLMNNQGGTVYLGVAEDQEGLGRPVGLTDDLTLLSERNNVRASLDDYVVYINRKGSEWLGETFWSYVSIDIDNQYCIVKINVKPYPYDVVTLKDKKAYLRKNNSTEEIKEDATLLDIRRRRQDALRKIDDKLINLQDAIQKERKVRLIGYHSSNSEKISNRIVEPFQIDDNEYVICYEPAEAKVKMFRISRIDKVAVMDEPWSDKSKHKRPYIDVFHMAEDSAHKKDRIKVTLTLKLRAKNALCETYPKTEECLKKVDNDTWQFETTVNSLMPLMHFYLNYAESITIDSAPGLLQAIRDYITNNIPLTL